MSGLLWRFAFIALSGLLIWVLHRYVGTVLLLLALAAYSWRKRSVPGALPFTIYCLLTVPMLVFKIIAYLAVDFETKVFWFKIENSFWLPILTAMTCFALEYARPGRWLVRRNLALFSIVPLLTLALLATNDSHHLLFTGFGFNGSVIAEFGPFGIFNLIYTIVLTGINVAVFAWLFVRSPQHRWSIMLILAAQVISRGLTFIDSLIRDSWFLYVPEVAFSVVACAIALFAFGIFDPVPLARQTAIQQMRAGMLVLDTQERVASLNPAAEQMLGVAANYVTGTLAQLVLVSVQRCYWLWPDLFLIRATLLDDTK